MIPIRCFTCNKVLADKYLNYKKYIKEFEKQKDDKKTPECKALDKVGLKKYCCRSIMLSTT